MKTRMNYSELFVRSMKDLAQGQDIPHLAVMLAQEIGKAIIITDAVNRVLVIHDPLGTGVSVGEFFPLRLGKGDDIEADFFTEVNQLNEGLWETEKGVLNFVYYALKVPGKLYGHCIVLCANQDLKPSQRILIQQVSLTLLLALKEALIRETERGWLLDEFIYDVLYNNYDSKIALYEKARRLHWNIEGPFAIIVLEPPADKLLKVRRLGPSRFNSFPPIYTVINENVVVILSLTNFPSHQIKGSITQFLTELLGNLAFCFIKDVRIGVGSTADALTDLHQRFQEAKIALELGKVFGSGNISHFDDMGFLKFIFTAPAQEL
ncbi:MAG: PucR family transcriptional regulator [Desulfitobacterium sp.]